MSRLCAICQGECQEPKDHPPAMVMVVPATVSRRVQEKVAASPTASGMKNILMEAMLRAMPPHLQKALQDYDARQRYEQTHPDTTIIDGEVRHAATGDGRVDPDPREHSGDGDGQGQGHGDPARVLPP